MLNVAKDTMALFQLSYPIDVIRIQHNLWIEDVLSCCISKSC